MRMNSVKSTIAVFTVSLFTACVKQPMYKEQPKHTTITDYIGIKTNVVATFNSQRVNDRIDEETEQAVAEADRDIALAEKEVDDILKDL